MTIHLPGSRATTDSLRTLFEESPALVALIDGRSQAYLFANAAYRETFFSGFDPVGRTVVQMLPEADSQGFVEILTDVFLSRQPFEAHEIRFVMSLANGGSKLFYFNLVYKPVHDGDDNNDSTLIVATDVTEAVLNRELARQSQHQLQIALESGRMGAWRIDLVSGEISADATFQALHHMTDQEEVEAAITRIGHPDDQQMVRDALARAVKEGVPYDVEYRVVRPDGTVRWIAARGNAIQNDAGRRIAITGVAFNIDSRKAAESAQAAAHQRDAFLLHLDDALRDSHDPAALQRTAMQLLAQQLPASRIFYSEFDHDSGTASVHQQPGTPDAPIAGAYAMDDFPAYLKALRAGPVVMSSVSAASFLTVPEQAALARLEVASLLTIPIIVTGQLVASLSAARGRVCQWTENDKFLVQATAERSWPGVLQARAHTALREAARRKDEFLAMLAHELRNPLAPIGAAAHMLQSEPCDVECVQQASDIIGRQVRHMSGLVDDLLDVSRVTTGLITLDRTVLDIRQIVSDAIEQVTPQLRARGHQLSLHAAPDMALVRGDHQRLVQVLANLLGNAAKYTPDGGQLAVATTVRDDHVMVSVTDNGIGMTPELKARAFELFAQAERSTDRSSGGLGLGLALVKSLVELHEGSIECDSAGPGQRSRFTVSLPRAMPAAPVPGPAVPGLHVLVVDDNVDAAAVMVMLLEAWGHTVSVEYGASGALARAQAEAPQVCLLDIGLPGMDGNELARCLRADPATAGALLIAVTGYGAATDATLAREAGFDHHFMKPVAMASLNALLEEFAVA